MNGTSHHKKISILNIYAQNTGASIYIQRCNDHKSITDTNIVIVGDLIVPLSKLIGHSDKRKFRGIPHIRTNRIDIYREFQQYWQTEFNSTLKRSYIKTKSVSFQGCKDGSTYVNP
jgi:hypothetical protein